MLTILLRSLPMLILSAMGCCLAVAGHPWFAFVVLTAAFLMMPVSEE